MSDVSRPDDERTGGSVDRRSVLRFAALGAAGVAAGCSMTGSQQSAAPTKPVAPRAPTGTVLGSGSTTVAMLLPEGAGGAGSTVAANLRNAATLALADIPDSGLRILVKDTGGTEAGGRVAAQTAIAEGARFIIGPVFAPAVSGAGQAARAAGVPVVAFSSDASVASRGVYLLSFLPAQDVNRIVSYAARTGGRQSLAALLPNNGYGQVTEAALRQVSGSVGMRVVAIERYNPGDIADMQAKARAVAALSSQIDSVLMPDGGDAPATLAGTLAASGMTGDRVKLLGSGQWDNPSTLRAPALAGAWFPGPDKAGFNSFAQRYRARFGSDPLRIASLGYDGTVLAIGLLRVAGGPSGYTDSLLTSRDGFLGVDGIFRFLPDGRSQRGLAVYEIGSGGSMRVLDPAPRSFATSIFSF
ncbi:penicillin-binding protein activator [Segnochrobactraceae bacterium EtOH-i3]